MVFIQASSLIDAIDSLPSLREESSQDGKASRSSTQKHEGAPRDRCDGPRCVSDFALALAAVFDFKRLDKFEAERRFRWEGDVTVAG